MKRSTSGDSWRPASVKKSSAVVQVISQPTDDGTAAEFYRETMESLKNPLLRGKALSFPPETSRFQARLQACHFDAVVGIVIVINMFFIGYSTEYSLKHWRDPESKFILTGEWTFLAFFVFELTLRFFMEGCHDFLLGANATWNGFDAFLISTSLVSQGLKQFQMGSGTMKTTTSLRVLRLLKMIRMLRVLRGAHLMHELRALLSSIASSCRILFWAMVMMLFIYYTFGLIFMNAVYVALPDIQDDQQLTMQLLKYYGTIRLTVLTLFMSTTGGMDWSKAADVLWPIGPFYYIIFLFYVSVVSFAVVNLITGLFVEGCMKAAEKDRILEMQDTKTETDDFKEAVKTLFMELVKDEDGILDREELGVAIQEPRMKAFMEWVQYDANEIITLFRILDKAGGSKGVTFDFFVESCFRFGQKTKGLDLLILLDEQEKVQKHISSLANQLTNVQGAVLSIRGAIHSLASAGSNPQPRMVQSTASRVHSSP